MNNPKQRYLEQQWRGEYRTADKNKLAFLQLVEQVTADPELRLQLVETARQAWKRPSSPRFDATPGKRGQPPQPFVRVGNPLIPGNTMKINLPKFVLAPIGWLVNRYGSKSGGGNDERYG